MPSFLADNLSTILLVIVFIASTLIGYKVISNVPSLLHTPLMSGMNALSGITVVGAIAAVAAAKVWDSQIIGAIAIILATINVVGGFDVTDRMLMMFSKKKKS